MAKIYEIHPDTPQERRIEEVKEALQKGAIMLYPTDTVYAIGCDLYVKSAVERVRQLKQLSNDKPLTFLSSSLSDISQYAWVTDPAYRLMKHLIPGPYTFLLPATKLVPKLVMSPKRKTTGIRVPDQAICQSLINALGHPIISTSAYFPNEEEELPTLGLEKAKLFDALDPLVDVIIDHGLESATEVSTIIDLTAEQPAIVRQGAGWDQVQEWVV